MRVIIANEKGVQYHTGVLKEEPLEYYCSCSKKKSPRDIQLKDGNVFIFVPNREYAAVVLRKVGSNGQQIRQHNTDGVSIYTTDKFMVMIRFANSYQSAVQYIQKKSSLPAEEEKYIVSTKNIIKVPPFTGQEQNPNEIFVYESSFGDVFSGFQENYTGEQTSGSQQLQTNLKRSSYSTIGGSYPTCWL